MGFRGLLESPNRPAASGAACNFGIRQRLKAAAVKVNNHQSLSRPRNFTLRSSPMDFIQPKGFSTQ